MKYLLLFMPFACLGESEEINTAIAEIRAFSIKEFDKSERVAETCDEESFGFYHFIRGRSSAFCEVIYFIDHQQ